MIGLCTYSFFFKRLPRVGLESMKFDDIKKFKKYIEKDD